MRATAVLFPACSSPSCGVPVVVLCVTVCVEVPCVESKWQLGRRRDVCEAIFAASHRRRRVQCTVSFVLQSSAEAADSIPCCVPVICRETNHSAVVASQCIEQGVVGSNPAEGSISPHFCSFLPRLPSGALCSVPQVHPVCSGLGPASPSAAVQRA